MFDLLIVVVFFCTIGALCILDLWIIGAVCVFSPSRLGTRCQRDHKTKIEIRAYAPPDGGPLGPPPRAARGNVTRIIKCKRGPVLHGSVSW